MPGQDGIDTIRTVRREHPTVKTIAMSGAFGGQFLKTAELLGADATLSKPVLPERLISMVAEVCGRALSPVFRAATLRSREILFRRRIG
jgi:DNA-binding NarL/FixJ family response regulator